MNKSLILFFIILLFLSACTPNQTTDDVIVPEQKEETTCTGDNFNCIECGCPSGTCSGDRQCYENLRYAYTNYDLAQFPLTDITFTTWPDYTGKSVFWFNPITFPEAPSYSEISKYVIQVFPTEGIDVSLLKYTNLEWGHTPNAMLEEAEDFNSPLWKDVETTTNPDEYVVTFKNYGPYILFEVTTDSDTGIFEIPIRFIYKDQYFDEKIYVNVISDPLLMPEDIPEKERIFVHGFNYEKIATCGDEYLKNTQSHPAHATVERYARLWSEGTTDAYSAVKNIIDNQHDAIRGEGTIETDLAGSGVSKYGSRRSNLYNCLMDGTWPDWALLEDYEKTGVLHRICTPNAMLTKSLLRAKGIPVKPIELLSTFGDPGHAGVLFYLPSHGWTYADASWGKLDDTDYPFDVVYGCVYGCDRSYPLGTSMEAMKTTKATLTFQLFGGSYPGVVNTPEAFSFIE